MGRITTKLLDRNTHRASAYAPMPLDHDVKSKKPSEQQRPHEQANELYEHFWGHWKQFHMDNQWFELEGISSYYYLSRIGAHSFYNFVGDHH